MKRVLEVCWKRGREGVGKGMGGAVLMGLGLLLAGEAVRARREGTQVACQEAAAAREVARLRRENTILREELRALETDPAYLEALLRRWKQAGAEERVVE